MGLTPGFRRRMKKSLKVAYAAGFPSSASLMSTPYTRINNRIAAVVSPAQFLSAKLPTNFVAARRMSHAGRAGMRYSVFSPTPHTSDSTRKSSKIPMVSLFEVPLATPLIAPNKATKKVDCNGVACTIRPATIADYEALYELVPIVSRCPTKHSESMQKEIFGNPWYHPYVLCRDDTGEVVTFAELIRMPHIGRMYDSRLERVVTKESFRRRGAATKLCQFVVLMASKLGCCRIDLTVENPIAKRIYANLGFDTVTTEVQRVMLTESNLENISEEFKGHFDD